jgi:hypothetical protein
MSELLGGYVLNILAAVAVLVFGWLIALVAASLIRGALRKTGLSNRLGKWLSTKPGQEIPDVERPIAQGVFYLIMLFVLVGFFQTLQLTLVTEPLNNFLNKLFNYAPQLLAAGILIVLAWGMATVARFLVSKGLAAVDLDRRLGRQTGEEDEKAIPLAKTISDAVYWLVLLLFLPAVLTALNVEGLLTPVQEMVGKILNFLPNLFAAVIIFVVGWFVARIVQRIVSNLLAAVGADRLGDRVGLAQVLGQNRLSDVLGLVVYVLVLIPVLIAFLSALQIEAVTKPASEMLNTILGALPNIFGAALVISIAYVVGRVVANLVAQVLAAVGFNKVPALLGLGKEQATGKQTPAQWVGTLLLIAIVLLAVLQALQLMGFTAVGDLVHGFLMFAWQVLLGLVIIGLGLYFGKLVAETILTTGMSNARLWATTARVMVIVLASAMGLQQMGLGERIIEQAFGLTLGAIAVAVAISFGIGGRDAAKNAIDNFLKSRKNDG